MSHSHISRELRSIPDSAHLYLRRDPNDSFEAVPHRRFKRDRFKKKNHRKFCHDGYCFDPSGKASPVSETVPALEPSLQTPSPLLPDQPLQGGPAGEPPVPSGSGTASEPFADSILPSFVTSTISQPVSTSGGSSFSSGPPFSLPTQSASSPSTSSSASLIPSSSMSSSLSSVQPTSSFKPNAPQSQLAKSHIQVGAIVGGLFGSLIFITLVAFAAFYFVRRRRKQVAPSAEFRRGAARPSFLRVGSADNLGRVVPPSSNNMGGYNDKMTVPGGIV